MTALIQDGDLLVIYNLINGMITGGKLDVNADITPPSAIVGGVKTVTTAPIRWFFGNIHSTS